MTLSSSNRKHALSALAALSKYQGRYDQYLHLKQRYSLRWTSTSSVQSLQRFFNPDLTFDVMLSKVKEMIQALPKPMALVIKHAVLTGLSPAEAVESVRLQDDISSIRSGRQQQMYYNPERQTLERCDLSSYNSLSIVALQIGKNANPKKRLLTLPYPKFALDQMWILLGRYVVPCLLSASISHSCLE